MTDARQFRDDYEHLLAVLRREMELRPRRTAQAVSSLDHLGRDVGIAEWVAMERHALRDAVNDLRVERGLPVLYADSIARAEQAAVGHIDYATKLALRCAELCQQSVDARS